MKFTFKLLKIILFKKNQTKYPAHTDTHSEALTLHSSKTHESSLNPGGWKATRSYSHWLWLWLPKTQQYCNYIIDFGISVLSLRVLKLGKVKQFLPSYILLKNFYFNTIYRAEQRGLVTMYICYIYLCDQYTKRKQNIKERIDQSLNISMFKGTRFFCRISFPCTHCKWEWVSLAWVSNNPFRYQMGWSSSMCIYSLYSLCEEKLLCYGRKRNLS